MSTPVGILGFSGYSGIELIDILKRHPRVEPILGWTHRGNGHHPWPSRPNTAPLEQPFRRKRFATCNWRPSFWRHLLKFPWN